VTQNTGVNGLPRIRLTHPSGASVELYQHGAHVTSWKTVQGAELLFLSRESRFEREHPIRGGIPVVFPQFSDDGPLPKHGFARTNEWTLADSGQTPAGDVFATLRFEADAGTLRLWPYRFALEYSVCLSGGLKIRLAVLNTGALPLQFQAALHTYFLVADIRRTAVLGLKGVEYADSLRPGAREKEQGERIEFGRETDRVYLQAPNRLSVRDEGNARSILVEKQGMNDVVVWNPWIDKAKRMEDFGDEEYRNIVCVETGNIGDPFTLSPDARWEGVTTFSVRSE